MKEVLKLFNFKKSRLKKILQKLKPGIKADVLFDYYCGDGGRPLTRKEIAQKHNLNKITVQRTVGEFQERFLISGTGLGESADRILKSFQIEREIWDDYRQSERVRKKKKRGKNACI